MDIDQLKLILETVTSLGAEGKSTFIWWLVLDKGISLICWSVFLFVFYRVAMTVILSSRTMREFHTLRSKAGISNFGPLTDRELTRTIEYINRCIEK